MSTGDVTWRVALVRHGSTMTLRAPADPAVPARLLEFFVSRDEEHARALLHVRGGVVDLGERAHHYSLVTLARARSADMQAGYDAATQGWIELDRLARMLGIDTSHLNVQIHRARSQFAALPGLDVSQLVERRRGSVRFGDFRSASCAASASNASRCRAASRASACIVRRRTRSSIAREHGTTIRVADRGTLASCRTRMNRSGPPRLSRR